MLNAILDVRPPALALHRSEALALHWSEAIYSGGTICIDRRRKCERRSNGADVGMLPQVAGSKGRGRGPLEHGRKASRITRDVRWSVSVVNEAERNVPLGKRSAPHVRARLRRHCGKADGRTACTAVACTQEPLCRQRKVLIGATVTSPHVHRWTSPVVHVEACA